MISIDDRIRYYIGTNATRVHEPVNKKFGYDVPIFMNYREYLHNMYTIHPNTAYPIDVSRLLKYSYPNKLWIQCGDSPYTGPEWPVGVKVRDTLDPLSKGVIVNLESPRHWENVLKYPDNSWETKCSDFIWRGADTGKGVRLDFVNKFKDNHDVGFSEYVQDALLQPSLYPQDLIKPKMSIPDILRYKYLPVIDGNDKSSSLNWVLGSNSIPIMPKPRFHSWLCEEFLEPNVHYVEVKRDFSDMLEKIEWCRENDSICKDIAENGKKFILQFMNPAQDRYIEEQLTKYMEQI